MKDELSAAVKLTYVRGEEKFFGPGIAELLERVEDEGSVKEACRAMGLSYSKGRAILRRAEEKFGFALISVRHGGAGGGAAALTEEGRRAVDMYRILETDIGRYARERVTESLRDLRIDADVPG